MNLQHFLKFFIFTSLFLIQQLTAHTLLEERNFNVTLNFSKAHYLVASDLDFKILSSSEIEGNDLPIESTTGKIAAFSNSWSGYFVAISTLDPKYLSDDGYSFLMRSNDSESDQGVSFILHSSYNSDGTLAQNGSREIFPGSTLIEVNGGCGSQKIVIDLWATLTNSDEIFELPSDFYKAILTISQFTND